MQNYMNRFRSMLKEKGYKLTPQREATLKVILQNQGKHMSAEEIYNEVKKECPEIGLATVYRAMVLLEELGILYKHNFEDGKNRYELSHPDEDHRHHHIICIECGKVEEVEEDLLGHLEEEIEKKYHFKIIDHQLEFYGYCSACRR